MGERWRRISVRSELVQVIEEIIEKRPELGYGSISDFITDSVRRRVEEIASLGEAPTLDKAIKVLAEHEIRRQAMEKALKKCFEFEGGEFWRCIAGFVKKETDLQTDKT
ncbi:MAG: ribbon-helix-helix domain-containing protein [Candidatus Bathyarchaeia archaeon]